MAIQCAYCGGEHDRPDQVRGCWTANGERDIAVSDGLPEPPPPAYSAPPANPTDAAMPLERSSGRGPRRAPAVPDEIPRGVAPAAPGPDRLARNAVVSSGSSAPSSWHGCSRLSIDIDVARSPVDLNRRLREAAAAGERVVIEIHDDLAAKLHAGRVPALMTSAAPFEVRPDFAFAGDELHHLIWSNSIDLRGDVPAWDALDRAVALGLTPAPQGTAGDVLLADGTAVWLDGGPLRFVEPIDGVPVVHVVTVEHGRVAVPTTNRCEADLAPDQLAAVTHPGGAARIIAPAGSGKTRVLTERARHLLGNWNLPATAVSLVAFNKRAQEEMRERTPDLPDLHVRTLNAIALAIVNGSAPFAPQPTNWRTINEIDVRRIIGDLVSFPKRRNSDPVAPWIEALSLVRLGLVDPDEVEQRYDGDVDGFAEFWPTYRATLEQRRAVDFDDQIYRALMILLADPAARRVAQRACRTMLVDEFQDLTPAHLLLIRLLAAPGGAVFGVGDDDQTIYGYNGADPGWLIDFGDFFPGAGAHPLEVNYRCPAGIVDIADRLLRHNGRRVAKTIRSNPDHPNDAADTDVPVPVGLRRGWKVDTSQDPVGAAVDAVRDALANGAVSSDVAVLARVNAVLAPVQVALVGQGIPVSGGVGLEFVERTSVRSVLAWLRLATTGERGRFAPADIGEALRRPSRSFHPRITSWISEQGTLVDLFKLAGRLNSERDVDRLMEFGGDIQTMQKAAAGGATTSDLVFTLIDEIGLAGSVAGLDATRRGMNRSAQGDDLTAVQHLAALHDDPASFDAWLREQLSAPRSSDGVVLSTVHRVKGQEWPHVVAHHVDAEQYPHRLAEDVEEERRLFHVGITRASRHVTIITGPDPSPFVDELTNEPSERRVVSTHRPDPIARAAKKQPKAGDPTAELDPVAAARFDRLKVLRTELAAGKPAYVVFDNKTLVAIARTNPVTKQEMMKISGIGQKKFDAYGEAFISLLATLD